MLLVGWVIVVPSVASSRSKVRLWQFKYIVEENGNIVPFSLFCGRLFGFGDIYFT